jgi:ATP-dependent helicase/nuclease subunit A
LRTIFAVGDEKQSIFGFQGANPEQFDQMRRHFQRRAGFVDHDFEKVELTVSFRSTREVLQAVDRVFSAELAAQGMTSFGATPVHEPFRFGHAGLVEIWPPEMPDEEEPSDPWDAPLDYTGSSSPRIRLAHKIAATIKDWITSEKTLTPRGRPIRADDILILVRRRNNFVEAMVDALKAKGVAVAGIDRMKLSQQLAIMDLLALARFVLLPQDDLNLAVVLKGPLFGLNDDDLFELAHDRQSTLWRALQTSRFTEVLENLVALLKGADKTPPYEFFARILNGPNGRQKFIKRLGLEVNDPIDEFLSLCLDYETTATPSLQGFIAWFGAAEVEAKRNMDQGRNEVRIMTVHGAKGLEANIVILPDTCHHVPDSGKQAKILTTSFAQDGFEANELLMWRPNKTFENDTVRQSLEREQQVEIEEYNRLLYVAMTRARDRLYIAAYEGKKSSSERSWYHLASAALKPDSKEIRDAQGNILCWRMESEQHVDPFEKTTTDGNIARAQTPPPWARQPVKPEPPHIDLVSPSRLGLEEDTAISDPQLIISSPQPSPLQSPPEVRFLRGRLIHKLLEYAPGADQETYGDFCQQFLQRCAPSFSEPERVHIVEGVQRVLGAQEFSALFDAQGLSEVPIVGQVHLAGRDAPVKVSGRIDRLIVGDTQVLAIDFKTDRIIADSPQTINIGYLRQMAIYRHLLTKVFPDRQIICHLLWTTGPLLMELPEALLSSALKTVTE